MTRIATMMLGIMLAAAPHPGAVAVPGAVTHAERQRQAQVTLDQAVAIARRHVDGKVIGADTRERRGRIVHQVKILTPDGTVRTIRVDGETGRVLR